MPGKLTVALDVADYLPDWLSKPWFSFINQYMEVEEAGTYFILVLLILGVLGIWLWWDSFDFFDFLGALALLLAYIISPLVLFAYLGAKGLAFVGTWIDTRVPPWEERWFRRWGQQALRHRRFPAKTLSKQDREVLMNIKIDDELSAEEVDPNVERYVASGRKDEAINYVRDILHVARAMNDKHAIKRYEKYLLVLRLGPRRTYRSRA